MPRDGEGQYSIGSDDWPGMSKVLEEMGELQQVLGKIMGTGGSLEHWDGDLDGSLVDEIGDVYAALDFFVAANDLPAGYIRGRREQKKSLFATWHEEGLSNA